MQQCFDTLEVTTCNAVVEASCMNDRGNTKDNKMGIKNDDKDGPKIKGCTVAQIHGGPRTKQTQKNDSYGVIINRKSRREHNQDGPEEHESSDISIHWDGPEFIESSDISIHHYFPKLGESYGILIGRNGPEYFPKYFPKLGESYGILIGRNGPEYFPKNGPENETEEHEDHGIVIGEDGPEDGPEEHESSDISIHWKSTERFSLTKSLAEFLGLTGDNNQVHEDYDDCIKEKPNGDNNQRFSLTKSLAEFLR